MSSSSASSFSDRDVESGYASASSSTSDLLEVYFTKAHLNFLNKQLRLLEPEDILKWCLTSLPSLYQTTSFGLTGLVTIDLLSKIASKNQKDIDLIFLDTLYHFSETWALVDRVKARYPQLNLHVYRPAGVETTKEFETAHGERLWETNDEQYDWLAKVEPAQRAYAELGVKAVLTGRRRSQGGKRGDLDIVEVDEAGLIKVNPLANWTFQQVQDYVKANDVPYNELLDRGYKSVGDWHSTKPVAADDDERSGRWSGTAKSECGIHNKRSRYAQYLMDMEMKKQEEMLSQGLEHIQLEA